MADMELLEKVCARMNKELLDQYTKMERLPQISMPDLEAIDLILHSIKSVKTVMAMEKSSDYSNDRYDYRNSLVTKLENMMRDVHSEDEAMAIQDAINGVMSRAH